MKSELLRRFMLWMVALTGLLAFAANASAGDLFLDHRRSVDRDGNKYFVVFALRSGNPGHAFVVWKMEDSKRRVTIQQAYGYYPSRGIGVFGSIPTALRNDAVANRPSVITDRMIVQVNRDWFENTKGEIARSSTNDQRLYASNCIDFLRAVTQRTNTFLPARKSNDTPSSHLLKIMEKNRR